MKKFIESISFEILILFSILMLIITFSTDFVSGAFNIFQYSFNKESLGDIFFLILLAHYILSLVVYILNRKYSKLCKMAFRNANIAALVLFIAIFIWVNLEEFLIYGYSLGLGFYWFILYLISVFLIDLFYKNYQGNGPILYVKLKGVIQKISIEIYAFIAIFMTVIAFVTPYIVNQNLSKNILSNVFGSGFLGWVIFLLILGGYITTIVFFTLDDGYTKRTKLTFQLTTGFTGLFFIGLILWAGLTKEFYALPYLGPFDYGFAFYWFFIYLVLLGYIASAYKENQDSGHKSLINQLILSKNKPKELSTNDDVTTEKDVTPNNEN